MHRNWSGWLLQMRVGKRLLGESNTAAGVVVLGDLGWGELEERREEMVLFGKRLVEIGRNSYTAG